MRLDAITLWEDEDATKDEERRASPPGRVTNPDGEPWIEVRLTVCRYNRTELPTDPRGWTAVVSARKGPTWPQSTHATGLEVTQVIREKGYIKLRLPAGGGVLPLP